ncbi:hypothetical protein ACHQM5_015271 [Ranunculus cassubicifolius]
MSAAKSSVPWRHPEKEGWLEESEVKLIKSGIFQTEKLITTKYRRWYVLKNGKLYRFQTSQLNHLSKPDKTIVCDKVQQSLVLFSFIVNHTPLYAYSQENKDDWIRAIENTQHPTVVKKSSTSSRESVSKIWY